MFTSLPGTTTTLLPHLRRNLPYEPLRDFDAVGLICSFPNMLVVRPSLPAKDLKALEEALTSERVHEEALAEEQRRAEEAQRLSEHDRQRGEQDAERPERPGAHSKRSAIAATQAMQGTRSRA